MKKKTKVEHKISQKFANLGEKFTFSIKNGKKV